MVAPGAAALAPTTNSTISRRLFVRTAGWSAIALLAGEALAGTLRFLQVPAGTQFGELVHADSEDSYKVGDLRFFPKARMYVVREPDGLVALSATCPRLVTPITWETN